MSVNFADYSYMSKKYQESQKALEKAVKVRNDATLEASKHIENNIKLQKEIVTLTARIAELEAERRWIPVSERLPDTKIVYDEFDVIVELVDIVSGEKIRRVDLLSYDYRDKSWNDDCWKLGFYPVTGVTHWRERPIPPEVQE